MLNAEGSSGDIPETETKTDLSNDDVTLSRDSFVYNGKARKPGVSVKVGSSLLKAGTDYTVSYNSNKKVGTAAVKISGKGDYTGTAVRTFTILPKRVSLSGV